MDSYSSPRRGGAGRGRGPMVRCYNCGEPGHHSRDCSKPPMTNACYNCSGEGHLSRDW